MNTYQLDKDVQLDWVGGSDEDTIYYTSFVMEDMSSTDYIGAYSIKEKTNKILYETKQTLRDMHIDKINGIIYFVEDGENAEQEILYSYDTKTGDITELLTFYAGEYNENEYRDYFYRFFNNQFIYQEKADGYLYSYDLESKEKKMILKDIPYVGVLFMADKLYYSKIENGMCSVIKTDGINSEIIYTKSINEGLNWSLGNFGNDKINIHVSDGISMSDYFIIDTFGNEFKEENVPYSISYLE